MIENNKVKEIKIKNYVEKAKSLNEINPENACIYLCCRPTRDFLKKNKELIKKAYEDKKQNYFNYYYSDDFLEQLIYEAEKVIKIMEKNAFKKQKYLRRKHCCAAAIYVASIRLGKKNSQRFCRKIFGLSSSVTLRRYIRDFYETKIKGDSK